MGVGWEPPGMHRVQLEWNDRGVLFCVPFSLVELESERLLEHLHAMPIPDPVCEISVRH